MPAVHRYEIPVDGQRHELELSGPVLHVDSRRFDSVEVWVLHTENVPATPRAFQVCGTGQPLPDGAQHRGTALAAPGGRLVWHLMEVP